MSATGVGDPRPGRPGSTGRTWRTAAVSPLLWGACLAAAAVGLATTAHAAGFGVTTPTLGGATDAVVRCAPSSGLRVTPVLAPELAPVPSPAPTPPPAPAPAVVAYRVTAVTVTGLSGCAGSTVSVTIRGTANAVLAQTSGVVAVGADTAVLPLPARMDPLAWRGWSANVGPS